MPVDDIKIGTALRMPPKRAIEYFDSKGAKITWDWREQLQMNNHLAFTVAKVAKMDVLMDMRGMISKALKEGLPFKEFQKQLQPLLANKGWAPDEIRAPDGKLVQQGAPARLKTIYETNMQSAYNAGRFQSFDDNKASRPYLEYVAIVDGSTRASHLELNGQRHPIDSNFWSVYTPANGYRCRCRVRALSKTQYNRRGGKSGKPVFTKGPKQGQTVRPDVGFSGNPGTKNWQPNPAKYDKDIWGVGQTVPPPPKPKKPPPFKQEPPEKQQLAKIGKTKNFQAQKTIAAAEKWGVENGVAKKIDYTGIDIAAANDTNKTIWNLRKKYKTNLDTIAPVRVGSEYANVSYSKTRMELNPKWMGPGNLSKFDKQLANDLKTEYHVKCRPGSSSVEQVVTHEFGHSIVNVRDVKGLNRFIPAAPEWQEIKKIRGAYRKELKKTHNAGDVEGYNKTLISRYAHHKYSNGDDYSEFIAEGFLQYELGIIQTNPFVNRLGQLIKNNMGK